VAHQHYDLLVIGSGLAGQKGDINDAKRGKQVALLERDGRMGGVSIHSGTIPCKTLRRAVLYPTGLCERTSSADEVFGQGGGFRAKTLAVKRRSWHE
jgi:pyruvate/2-oxoglutarate dehydrogenase complex dihydrolipoamide dehydrogenase (E3) component